MKRKPDKILIILAVLPIILALTALAAGIFFHIQDRREAMPYAGITAENTTLSPASMPQPYISEYGRTVVAQFLEAYKSIFIPVVVDNFDAPFITYVVDESEEPSQMAVSFRLLNLKGNAVPEILIHFSDMHANGGFTVSQLFVYTNGEYWQAGGNFVNMQLFIDENGRQFMSFLNMADGLAAQDFRVYYIGIHENELNLEPVSAEVDWEHPVNWWYPVPIINGQALNHLQSMPVLENAITEYLTYKLSAAQQTPSPTPASQPYISEYGRRVAMEFLIAYTHEYQIIPEWGIFQHTRFRLFDFNGNGVPDIQISYYYTVNAEWSVTRRLFMHINGEYQHMGDFDVLLFFISSDGQPFMEYSENQLRRLYYMYINDDGLTLELVPDEHIIDGVLVPSMWFSRNPIVNEQPLLHARSAVTLELEIAAYLAALNAPQPTPVPTPTPRPTPMPEPYISEYGRRVAMEFLYDYMREFIAAGQLIYSQPHWRESEWRYATMHFTFYDFSNDGIPSIVISFMYYLHGLPHRIVHIFAYINGEYQHAGEFSSLRFFINNYGQQFIAYVNYDIYPTWRHNTFSYIHVGINGLEFEAVSNERIEFGVFPSAPTVVGSSVQLDGQWLPSAPAANTVANEIWHYLNNKLNHYGG